MTPATLWRLCAIIGLPAIAAFMMISRSAGLSDCGPSGEMGPVLALEFVRNMADVQALVPNEACKAGQLTALDRDTFAFIPLYILFLALAAWASGTARVADRGITAVALAALLVAALFDIRENAAAAAILDGKDAFELLFWNVRVKFAAIASGLVLIGLLLLRHEDPVRLGGYGVMIAGAGSTILLLLGQYGVMIRPIAFGMVLVWLIAVGIAIRPALVAPPKAA